MTGTRPSCSSRSICDKTSDAAPLMTRQSWGYPQSDMQIVDSRKRDEFCFSHTKFSDEDLEPGSTAADTGGCSQTHTQAKGHRRTRLSKKKKKKFVLSASVCPIHRRVIRCNSWQRENSLIHATVAMARFTYPTATIKRKRDPNIATGTGLLRMKGIG